MHIYAHVENFKKNEGILCLYYKKLIRNVFCTDCTCSPWPLSRPHLVIGNPTFFPWSILIIQSVINWNRQSRCYIQELDAGLADNNNVSLFEKEILSRYIPIKADGELDSCHRYSAELPFDNGSVDAKTTSRLVEQCNGQFVYDTSIYQQSRVYDVSVRYRFEINHHHEISSLYIDW